MIQFPPRRIVVSYDFTSRCRQALGYARDLASRFGGALEAVHVREWVDPAGKLLRGVLPPAARRRLEAEMAAELPGSGAGSCLAVEGSLVDRVLEVARRRRAGMIVLPASTPRFGPGSYLPELLRRSTVPVLSLHARVPRIRSVLLALDSCRNPGPAMDLASRSAAALGASFTALNGVRRRAAELSDEHGLLVLPMEGAPGPTAEAILKDWLAPVLTVPVGAA